MRTICLGLLWLALGGCSAGADDQLSRRSGVQSGGGDGDPAGESGAAGASAGDFGNSNATPIAQPPPTKKNDAGQEIIPGECEVGMFCKPTEPDPDNCGTLRLESDVEVTVTPGNVLIVFDQSGSMGDGWPGTGTSKLQAAQTALVSALTPLQDNLSAGAIFFPSFACIPVLPPPPGGAVAPLGAPEQIDFMPGPAFLQAWNTKWATPSISLGIGTPLQEAFDRADIAIQNTTFTGQLAVVVFTDGQPTCLPDPNLTMIPTALETDRATAWLGNNIKTYVVGLPGANGVAILDQIAQAGGTNSYIVPDDPATLEAELRTIVEETVKRGFDSCSINLTPAADVPDELLLIVEESGVDGVQQVPRDLGWSLSGDGAHVEITGTLCDDVMTGRFSSITFEYACPEAPPPPVLPPPD